MDHALRRSAVATALVLTAGLLPTLAGAAGPVAAQTGLPPIKHVWVMQFENESQGDATADAGYLGQTVPTLGTTLTHYDAVGHNSLDNYIAEISGQAPNPTTQDDCQTYVDVTPGTIVDGQATGSGCVYPTAVQTLADQLAAKGLSWKGYMGDMGNSPSRDHTDASGGCGHPTLGAADDTQDASPDDQYATRHDPFVYFHSIIDQPAACDNVVALTALAHDLASESTTPAYSWVTPNLCDDGHDQPCAGTDVAGHGTGGFTAIDDFLNRYVPMITGSPAFASGVLIVTFDESDVSDTASCCGATAAPGGPPPGLGGPGGGRVDTVVISPYARAGATSDSPYNHYSMLRTIEDLFGVSHLGQAGNDGATSFGSDVLTSSPSPTASSAPGTTAASSGSSDSSSSGGSSGSSGSSVGVLVVVAGVVVILAAGGGLILRRRSRQRRAVS